MPRRRQHRPVGGVSTDGTARSSLPALLSAKLSSAFVGVSLRTWWRLDSSGKVPAAVRVGNAKRWRTQELKDWIDSGCPDRAKWEATARSTAKK
jgi:predicted DNA-binding transcriptional regulator AlpA